MLEDISDIHIRITNDEIKTFMRSKKDILISNTNIGNKILETIKNQNINLEDINQKSITINYYDVRLRITVFKSINSLNLAIRVLSNSIPSFNVINAPKIFKELALKNSGLILFCGATSSGKSTSIASMVEFINENCKKHILVIEDTTEFIFTPKSSIISQIQCEDKNDFKSSIQTSMRTDPDIIVIGEILDSATLNEAIKLSLSGHLVISSFHANSCSSAISRMQGMCEENVFNGLSECLLAVITQRLYKSQELQQYKIESNMPLIPDFEVLIATPAVQSLIKDKKLNQLNSQIEMGSKEFGMSKFKY